MTVGEMFGILGFQSTRPSRGATAVEAHPDLDYTFQSTRPSRGATPVGTGKQDEPEISIHAPLAGRDDEPLDKEIADFIISIHAPLAGRDSKCAQKSRTYLR